eukprot:CAMPEP_0117421608 /NCGR_PEP_ID=MMETSP0758-20121206/2647_1 /TAXON_ID=63605 /ORGANISM="Percolomonas cosmopolitus, Strain AE-1 (ATCC 50343)" /LENGTH=409 /DNA_ID=CAMNT_0005203797 /DNA_START=273 /DNA_END=1500 /DNA_ORIENTATION=+
MMELLQNEFKKYESLKKEQNIVDRFTENRMAEKEKKEMENIEKAMNASSLDQLISNKVNYIKKKNEVAEEEDISSDVKKQKGLAERKKNDHDRKILRKVNVDESWDGMDAKHLRKSTGNMVEKEGKQLRCSLLGLPNTGKSTFLNRILKTKVSGESRKSCFTRSAIEGIYTQGNTQLIFVDTPGIVSKEENESLYNSTKKLASIAVQKVSSSDLTLVFFDGVHQLEKSRHLLMIIEALSEELPEHKFIGIINKIDLVHPHTRVLALMDEIVETKLFDRVFTISAKNFAGIDELKSYLSKKAIPSVLPYPASVKTTAHISTLCREIIREALFDLIHHEIPYKISYQSKGPIEEVHRVGGDVDVFIPLTFVVPTRSIAKTIEAAYYPISKYASKEIQKHFFKERNRNMSMK